MRPFDSNRILVVSGSYQIRKCESGILEAFLGSCVGVAIIDKKTASAVFITYYYPNQLSEPIPGNR